VGRLLQPPNQFTFEVAGYVTDSRAAICRTQARIGTRPGTRGRNLKNARGT